MVLQQAQAPSRHVQIISVRRQMHSNQFIIYFIIIPRLQFEADRFVLFMKGCLFIPGHFPSLCFPSFFAEHNPDLSSILMLPHSNARSRGGQVARDCVLFSG